jgi:hypothetical protein
MAVIIDVDPAVLDRARAEWRCAATTLDGAALRLAGVTGAGLAPPVRAEVERFAGRWGAEARSLVTTAEQAYDALLATSVLFGTCDREQAVRIRSLLPWREHDDPIVER